MKRTATVLVALAFVASACGGGGDRQDAGGSKSAADVVLVAAKNTTAAGSSKIAMTADFKAGETAFEMSGEGVFDYAEQTGRMTFKLTGDEIPEALSGYDMIFTTGIVYMKFPDEFAQFLPGLKPWIKMDLAEMAKQSDVNLPGFNSFTNQDPTSALAFMRGAEDVKAEGKESVRGVATTRYAMTIDMKKAVEAFPEDSRAEVQDLIDKAGMEKLPMQAWVDGDGRVRRMRFSMDLSKLAPSEGAEPGEGGVMTIAMDLFDFGTKVDVQVPAADQVSDYSELAKLGAGG